MKKLFNNRLEAINWIASHADNEGEFEILREQLNFNFIYTNELFVSLNDGIKEIVLLDQHRNK